MSRTEHEREIARARERADLARMRFGNAVGDVMDRLTPDRLRAEAIEVAADQLEQARRDILARFRHWPIITAAVGVAGIAITFWKPAREAARWAFRFASIVWSTRDIWKAKQE